MSNHQCRSVSARDPTLIQFHHLSYLCFVCFTYGSGDCCHQIDHVPEFSLYRLSPKAPCHVRRLYNVDEEHDAVAAGECNADGLCVGDSIAVRAPVEDEPYWLILIVKPTYVVEDAFTNPDGNSYVPGNVVFNGFWYERLREGSRTYLLRNDREASTVYSHVILTSKFYLPPIQHLIKGRFSGYELKLEVKETIDEALLAALLLE
jgi:hypothetical protein